MDYVSTLASQSETSLVAPPDLAIRPLSTLDEFAACVDVQRAVWAWADIDLMPVRLFVLMQHVGGLVLGAYQDDDLVGFVNCVPGMHGGRPFWHSHMLGVLPAYQNKGIGTALKLAQKSHALQRGIKSIQWVFDPLETKNAYLNIAKLGAIVRRYSVNHYGVSTSRLHSGLDSDRVVAEWRLDAQTAGGNRLEARSVFVPANVQALRREDPSAVKRLQAVLREQFQRNLSDGFVVVACTRHPHGSDYVFERREATVGLRVLTDACDDGQGLGGRA